MTKIDKLLDKSKLHPAIIQAVRDLLSEVRTSQKDPTHYEKFLTQILKKPKKLTPVSKLEKISKNIESHRNLLSRLRKKLKSHNSRVDIKTERGLKLVFLDEEE